MLHDHTGYRSHTTNLPKGLVGTKCTTQIRIAGKKCTCLLDTGSQVTTIPKSYYDQHLSKQPIHSLNNLLNVEGANGQAVPYLGYVEVTITFPKDFVGEDMEVPTLALIVPDFPSQCNVLVGMNTLDVLYKSYSKMQNVQHIPPKLGYRDVLKILQIRQHQFTEGNIGLARLPGKDPKVIPAGQSLVICASVTVKDLHTDKWAILEHPISPLPGGLIVKACMVTVGNKQHSHLPVVITNTADHDVAIPPRCIIAQLNAVQSVLPKETPPIASSDAGSKAASPGFSFSNSPISPEWKGRLTQKLQNMRDVFSQHRLDFGCTNKVKHRINLTDETPFKHRCRPIHPEDREGVQKHLQELLDTGVIRESESPFSSPIVVVRKKNGDIRLCIDYCKLNLRTVKDAYALPNLEDTFMALTGSKWFSVLDLKSGYYQIEVEEADKPKTAFVCPFGFYEFNRMPQGITNAPSTFQRIMEKCMAGLNLREVLVFLDDIIVFSKTLEEHEERLLRVLNRLRDYGLKLAPEKCVFAQTSVKYLGHVVSHEGVKTDPDKIAAVKTWPVPTNLKELKSFLGFIGYYRRFIKDFSRKIKPLNELTSGYPPTRKGLQVKHSGPYHNPREAFGSRWTIACQQAFELIIRDLTSAPVLAFANPQLPYIIHTDASTTGLGAALYQEQDGCQRVVAYASRGLSRSESRYPAHKLEFLALKWAVTEKFHDYLYGSSFTVVTDSNPLTYVLSTARLDATSYRWLASLSTYDFKLMYRSGKQNNDADGLSRRPHGELSDDLTSQKERERIQKFSESHLCDEEVTADVVRAICDSRLIQMSAPASGVDTAFVGSLTMDIDAIPDSFVDEDQCGGLPVISHLSNSDLEELQTADPCIREVVRQMKTGEKTSRSVREAIPKLPLLLRELDRLVLKDEVLYRKRTTGSQITYQLVLPEQLQSDVLKSLHDDFGHMGIDRTLDLVRRRFYWPRMAVDVEHKVKTCGRCVRRKALPEKAAPLVNITTSRPLQLVCMDFLSVEPDQSNTKDVLVITDHFTKYALAIPTPNQTAKTVAKSLWEHFISHYGYPERLHSDQGPDFESRLIKELCEIAGIQKIRTTPYHPRGNPVERFNRTLLSMLGTLENKSKSRWREFVKPLVHAYNCTKNDTTGFSPYELMFGREPRLPVDLAFGLPLRDKDHTSHSQYVQNLKSNLEESFRIAAEHSKKMAGQNKTRFDRHVTVSQLREGDRVLVRNLRVRGKHKLADKWEQTIYIVVSQAGDLPVYTVCPENQSGPVRTLHRDLLLPCSLPPEEDEQVESVPVRVRRTRRSRKDVNSVEEEGMSSDAEDDVPYFFRPNHFEIEPVKGKESCPEQTDQRNMEPNSSTAQPDTFNQTGEEEPQRNESDSPVNTPAPESDLPCTAEEFLGETNSPFSSEVKPVEERTSEDMPSQNILPEDRNPELTSVPEEGMRETQETQEQFISTDTAPDQTCEQEEPTLRRSSRHREPPRMLTYPEFGNPLVTIVRSLFQGLSTAIVESLPNLANLEHLSAITTQPLSMQRDLHIQRGRV